MQANFWFSGGPEQLNEQLRIYTLRVIKLQNEKWIQVSY